MSNYCIITSTFLSKLNKHSKKENWLCEGVPCRIIKNENDISYIKPFNTERTFEIEKDIYEKNFVSAIEDDKYVYCDRYPSKKIEKEEFDIKPILTKHKLLSSLKNSSENFALLIDKVYQDAYNAKGSTKCINAEKYNEYKNGNTVLTKLKNIGDPVFNRSSRHSPPVYKEFTYEDFTKTSSFPAPIGIRYEDFALPSEQNMILRELLEQLFNSCGAPECPENIKKILKINIENDSHKCRWCNEKINIEDINQRYCSAVHSINFCHIDPLIGTKSKNIYLGHCDCNREQGGYSETERVEQMLRLLTHNKDLCEKFKHILIDLGQ